MHLSENEGIEGNTFVVSGGLGFVGSALCLELVRRGASQVRAFDLRTTSPWSQHLKNNGDRRSALGSEEWSVLGWASISDRC